MSNTGGPAFPRNILDHGHGVTTTHESGMTLRDYFAAKAMQSFLTRETRFSDNLLMYAGAAYDVADAMLEARQT